MCGIAGFVSPRGLDQTADAVVRAMTDAIQRRGPDGAGHWLDAEAGVALGHRRLAIIDLSPGGHQPMASHDGRCVIVFNGEIYNYAEMRAELEAAGAAPNWTGRSDTEVLLAAIRRWGMAGALRRARGMFALAMWDRETRTLTLARDPMGEKPLYYGWQGQGAARTLVFGSDLAALRRHPAFENRIDRRAIGLLARYLYVPEPLSVYEGVAKLGPGSIVTLDPAGGGSSTEVYWDSLAVAAAGVADRFDGTPDEAVNRLSALLDQAVGRQMVADVPLGAFLSGGVDSSVVVAAMQRRSSRPVKTFTIGFEDPAYDESAHAAAVAGHLKTDHTALVVSPAEAQAVITDLPHIYSEPFADSSQIPTYMVSRLARQSVTVSLSGDGGDEVFGGYNRHRLATRYWGGLSRTPRGLRRGAASLMNALSPQQWDRLVGPLLGGRLAHPGDKIHKAAGVLASASVDDLYESLIAANPAARALMPDEGGPWTRPDGDEVLPLSLGAGERMMALDSTGYLPGDVLTKVDRAAMAVSLETRVPLLDPDVFAFAWTLPLEMKIRDGVSKWPLRQLLYRDVPRAMIERPKMGFGVPIGLWLRGPLRSWGEALLDPHDIEDAGLFQVAEVRRLWDEHQSGRRNNQHALWPVLMTQAWLKRP